MNGVGSVLRRAVAPVAAAAALVLPASGDLPLAAAGPAAATAGGGSAGAGTAGLTGVCVDAADPEPPEYYAFPLVSTERIPGTGRSGGEGRVSFPSSSPYGVALDADGSYRYELSISTRGLPDLDAGRYVVWVTTPELDRIRRVGPLPASGELRGTVAWNKFLVVVTLEPERAPAAGEAGDGDAPSGTESSSWSGPIVMRGMSRSGRMHTMAGHGPFEQENCAAYGY